MISPLQHDNFTRDLWGDFDTAAIQQMMPIAASKCYRPMFYKVPDSDQELMNNNAYAEYGFTITPGSLICGFYAVIPNVIYKNWLFHLRDLSLAHDLFDQPVPGVMVQNQQKTWTYPNLLSSPYPVVGSGQFLAKLWNQTGNQTRIQCVLMVAEVKA